MKMNKRIIISESERQSILNLHTSHKNKLNEVESAFSQEALDRTKELSQKISNLKTSDSTPAPVTPAPVTDRKVDCTSTKNPARCKQKVLDVQVKINDKCKTITQKLVEDGIFGNNTYNSIKTCTGMDLSSGGRAAAIKAATTAVNNTTTTPEGTTTAGTGTVASVAPDERGEDSTGPV